MWFSIKLAYVASLMVMGLGGPQAVSGRRPCYSGWTLHGRSCYVIVKDKQTWTSAQTSCQSLGGNLVQIESKAENDFVTGLMHKHGVDDGWIGMTDLETEGNYRWIFRHNRPWFTNFDRQEPNNLGGNEHCAHLRRSGKWNDLPCGFTTHFVCEA